MILSRTARDISPIPMPSKEGDSNMDELFSVITSYLARAGYEVLDGDAAKFVIRDKMKDEDFEITISEIAG